MWSVVVETLRILNESAVYLLVGFALAGVLHVVLSRQEWLTRMLEGTGGKSVVLAALFGAPLPLCSCSVLPAGLALRNKGASKGATISFLISVPETDIVSILLTYGLFGPVMAVFRPLAAIVTAIVTGCLVNLTERVRRARADATESSDAQESEHCDAETYDPKKGALWNAAHYGFVKFFDDIIGSLLVGIVLGGLITALMPSMGLERLSGNSLLTMLVMLVVGIPMYVCATSSTPIAAGLMIGGLSPGAALVFLLAGPATNLASLIVLHKYLGRLTLIVYLVCIAVISVAMGLWLDSIVTTTSVAELWNVPLAAGSSAGPIKIGGAILLALLSYASLRRGRAFERALQRINRSTGMSLRSGSVKVALIVLLVIGYVGSGFFMVQAGERAAVTFFGRPTSSDLAPGLHYRWPWPVGAADIESVSEVKRIELGFRKGAPQADTEIISLEDEQFAEESWMLTGNEDIVDIKCAVQYRVMASDEGFLDYIYGVAEQELVVRNATESAVRQAVGCRNIDTLLTTERAPVEEEVAGNLQRLLDRCSAGVSIVNVHLQDVHAPPAVHPEFRDVASAVEDKAKSKNQAQEAEERILRQARGDAAHRLADAQAKATSIVEVAQGEAGAFTDQLAAYRLNPAVTRLRLYFESVDWWMPVLTKYVNLAGDGGADLDLWLISDEKAAELAIPPTFQTTNVSNLGR